MGRRVVLAMSGGVDSSAAAVLLKQEGHEVIGLFMRSGAVTEQPATCPPHGAGKGVSPHGAGKGVPPHGAGKGVPPHGAGKSVPPHGTGKSVPPHGTLPILHAIQAAPSHKQGCCSASDAADARRVADRLDIPFYAINFQDAFGRIKDYFADEYLAGRTPNPCVMCNNWLKFGKLWEFARDVEADAIATGHYAQLRPAAGEDRPALVAGADRAKDQSYVLFGIARDLLDRILFPVGGYEKTAIRELAREAGLRVADKPDSQEICFIPDNDYAAFVGRHRAERDTAGELVDTSGAVLGRHDGYHRFTVGQRRGLGVAFGAPRFVVSIEPATRRVVIGTQQDLARTELQADGLNWLAPPPRTPFRCLAKIRYRHEAASALAHVDDQTLRVVFDEPQYGVTPGQAVVLYEADRVLGGGWIR